MIAYTQCLRDQGVDVPDPQIDEDGNLRMAVRVMGHDRDQMTKAQEVCGPPPRGAGGGFSHADQSAMQDAMLEFAECMRGEGIDMPDPDFSGGVMRMGPSEGTDRDDPRFSAAQEQCQSASSPAWATCASEVPGERADAR